jgi:hypothetical protein
MRLKHQRSETGSCEKMLGQARAARKGLLIARKLDLGRASQSRFFHSFLSPFAANLFDI